VHRVVWIALAILAVGGGLAALPGIDDGFSARAEPSRIETLAARYLRRISTGRVVREKVNPLRATPEILAEARDHFADHCSVCHAHDGSGQTPIGEGLYPPPPDLRAAPTQQLSDGELLHVIRDGVRFTGMPAFAGGDDETWPLVLFVRHLPELNPEELDLMREIRPE
jgi:mono/diheme cytochrome c family protein